MRTRPFVFFWAATTASVLLLGSLWSLQRRIGDPSFGAPDVVLLTAAALGFCATIFVAARIVLLVGRVQRRARHDRGA